MGTDLFAFQLNLAALQPLPLKACSFNSILF